MIRAIEDALDEVILPLAIFVAIAITAVGTLVIIRVQAEKHPKSTQTVYLQQYEDGIYARKTQVVSSIPTENYVIVTVIGENGVEVTVRGRCTIVFADYDRPYAVIEDYSIVNFDMITLYVPQGSVYYSNPVTA